MSEYLETFLVSRYDVTSLTKNLLMNCVYLSIMAHLVSLFQYGSAALHGHQFSMPDVFFEPLESFQIFLETLDKVVSQCLLAVGAEFKLS